MKVGSLFSGGGLGDYGLELAGMEIAFQVEIDEYCQKILNLRWPNVPKWRDIRTVNTAELPRIDVISGGFPCQDISTAGKGLGIDGPRSGLWKEYFRIICELRPKYVIVENVSALLTRGLGTVLGDLASIGYDAEWECLSAKAFGAVHRRIRVWIVAYPNGWGLERDGEHKEDGWRLGEPKIFPPKEGTAPLRTRFWETMPPRVHGMDDGPTDKVERFKLLGNGQLPQTMCWIGKRIMEFENGL